MRSSQVPVATHLSANARPGVRAFAVPRTAFAVVRTGGVSFGAARVDDMAMDASTKLRLDQQLATLNVAELRTVGAAKIAECADLQCQQDVLSSAITAVSLQIPKHVGEGTRMAIGVGGGFVTGLIRGAGGDFWGRILSAPLPVIGLAAGLISKEASIKAAGYSLLLGTSAGEAGIEAYDLGQILRAKMKAPVSKQTVAAT
jgi:hypothetical protein